MRSFLFTILLIIFIPGIISAAALRQTSAAGSAQCEPSGTCKECHADIFQQYNESSHAKAFSNPLFWAQYFKEVVPRAIRDKAFEPVARRCVFCHSPVLYMNYSGMIHSPEQAFFTETGVTCDFCHTVDGYTADGDYQFIKSGKKQGPFTDNSWHSQESYYIKSSDFCASCHNADNHLGAGMRTTYDEWRRSKFAESQLTCQDCHMNMHGYLKNGKAEFESGRAAKIKADPFRFKTESEVLLSPERNKLYTHQFRSNVPDEGAVGLDVKVGKVRMPDGKLLVNVKVDNNWTGHKLPSGSSDLRIIWLEIATTLPDGRQFTGTPLRARKSGDIDYGISGASPQDEMLLREAVPAGSRVYRTIFADSRGNRSLSFIDASKIIFDNRLDAGEVRYEKYVLPVPPEFSGPATITISMNYLGAPPSFTQRLGVPDYLPIRIKTLRKEIVVVKPGNMK